MNARSPNKLKIIHERAALGLTRRGTVRIVRNKGKKWTPVQLEPGYIWFKDWCASKGKSMNISYSGFYMRLKRGLEPWPELKRLNARSIMVKIA